MTYQCLHVRLLLLCQPLDLWQHLVQLLWCWWLWFSSSLTIRRTARSCVWVAHKRMNTRQFDFKVLLSHKTRTKSSWTSPHRCHPCYCVINSRFLIKQEPCFRRKQYVVATYSSDSKLLVSRFSHIHRTNSSGCQPNFAVLNRGRHLYSAGRPSCWALAHILVQT